MTFCDEEYPELTFNEEHQGPSLVFVVSIVTGSSPKLPALIKAHVLLIIVSCSNLEEIRRFNVFFKSHRTLCLEMIDTFYTFMLKNVKADEQK